MLIRRHSNTKAEEKLGKKTVHYRSWQLDVESCTTVHAGDNGAVMHYDQREVGHNGRTNK